MYFPQGPGRYYQWYIPVPPHLYPNYPVDPNHPWIPAPHYGNAPLLNGRQSETDGEQETNVDDERSAAGSFPPPGVGLPAASTMQQQPVYSMISPFSNMYMGNLPSGVNVQGFVNSPIPYPHSYQTSIATNSEMTTSQINSRGGRSSGKSSSGSKVTGEKGSGTNESSLNSQQSLTSQDSSSTNDPSTSTLTPSLAPPHPPTNFMPLGPVQYTYPYFPQTAPPPPHMTSAQHATGSPLYIPHTVPVYHPGPMYNSAPAAVFSTDNGIPHSAVSAAPISMQPQTNSAANHESESNNFVAKDTSLDDAYTNSNLMVDSPPFEQDVQKNNCNFGQEDISTLSEVISENTSLPNNSDQSIPSEIPCSTEKDDSSSDDHFRITDNSVSSNETTSCLEQPIKSTEKNAKTDSKMDNITNMVNDLNVKDECRKVFDKELDSALNTKNNASMITCKSTMKTAVSTDISSILTVQENGVNGSMKSNDTDSNESKNDITESNDSKSNTSQDTVSSKISCNTEIKNESVEEITPAPSFKTWASLFHPSSSSFNKSKTSSPVTSKPAEVSNNNNTTSAYINQNVDSHSTTLSSMSPMNGILPTQSSQNKVSMCNRHSSISSSSLVDYTTLPKIGGLLKSYRLDHKAVNFEPRGLENRSNYCYVNAILQALLACPPFYNLMKCISTNLHNPKTKAASKLHFPIIESMAQFVEEFKPISQKARMREKARKMDAFTHQELIPGKPFEPNSMLSVIQGNSLFTVGQQEDAQEFLTCLLNGLNDEMVELIQLADGNNNGMNPHPRKIAQSIKIPPTKNNKKISNGDISAEMSAPDDSDSEWKQVSSKTKSNRPNNLALTRTPLSEIFRGQTRSRLQKIGDQTTNNIEPFFTLHLNIEKVSSVKEALESLFGQSALEGVTSSRTNQEVDAWQQQTLEELPYVLLLHLKYFDYKHHTCTKILKNTEFPIDLKIEPKLISVQSRPKMPSMKSRQYKLFAVVYHDGKEATKGHYVTDVFHIGYGSWIRYDDAKVYSVSESDVLKPQLPRVPYLLYYRRCDTIAALMQPPFEKRM